MAAADSSFFKVLYAVTFCGAEERGILHFMKSSLHFIRPVFIHRLYNDYLVMIQEEVFAGQTKTLIQNKCCIHCNTL